MTNQTETDVLKQISVLTKIGDVVDQKMLRKLLIEGKAYSPQEGYVVATTPVVDEFPQLFLTKESRVWETRMPKSKHKGDTPIPYEFCAYANYAELPSDILRVTRDASFIEWVEHNGYKYKKIAGGTMRRPIN
jgi:hypothetical protein